MISRRKIDDECKRLEQSIDRHKKLIASLPKGILQCHRDGRYWHWYVVNVEKDADGKRKRKASYIKRDNLSLAKKLAEKEVLINEMRDEEKELKALKMYVRHRSAFESADKYINRTEEHQRLTADLFNNKWSQDIEMWLNDRSNVPPYKPENLTYRCRNGIFVRSKSEQLIAGALQIHNIPYKYEEPLQLGNYKVIPDFTILSPRDGKEYIWEHFGMMNNQDYCAHNLNKIQTYIEHGYIPFERLITTYESNDGGIDEVWIDRIIETFFE